MGSSAGALKMVAARKRQTMAVTTQPSLLKGATMNETLFAHAVTLTAGFLAASEKPPSPGKVERVLIANYRVLISAQQKLSASETSLDLPEGCKANWNSAGQVPKAG